MRKWTEDELTSAVNGRTRELGLTLPALSQPTLVVVLTQRGWKEDSKCVDYTLEAVLLESVTEKKTLNST